MQFNMDNRSGDPNVKKTLESLSKILKRPKKEERINQGEKKPKRKIVVQKSIELTDFPLIIQSRIGTSLHPAPYFEGSKIYDFIKAFPLLKARHPNFMFPIFANNFKEDGTTFESHMFVGLWIGSEETFYIIDPNGNDVTRNHIYAGRVFVNFPRTGQLINPLYNTLVGLLKPTLGYKIRFYTGEPLVCPTGSPRNCSYRSLMIMLGLMASPMLNLKEALEVANFLAVNKFSQVKTLSMKAFRHERNTKNFLKDFIQSFEKRNIRNKFNSV